MSSPVDHIYRRAGNETSDIAESYVEKALACGVGSPCDVRAYETVRQ